MKEFLKYLGPILILVGVALLAFYFFGTMPSNIILAAAGLIMIIGCASHIIVNKRME
jgi:predicted PurR-regulated permease PerM